MSVVSIPSTEPDLAAANRVRRSLVDFARRFRGLREDHAVSASKLSALGQIYRANGPISAGELARRERLQPQSVTRIIADLEERGLIVRSRSEIDSRQFDLLLSDAGCALLVRDAQRQNAWLAGAM